MQLSRPDLTSRARNAQSILQPSFFSLSSLRSLCTADTASSAGLDSAWPSKKGRLTASPAKLPYAASLCLVLKAFEREWHDQMLAAS
jgi:hypothetical protein